MYLINIYFLFNPKYKMHYSNSQSTKFSFKPIPNPELFKLEKRTKPVENVFHYLVNCNFWQLGIFLRNMWCWHPSTRSLSESRNGSLVFWNVLGVNVASHCWETSKYKKSLASIRLVTFLLQSWCLDKFFNGSCWLFE